MEKDKKSVWVNFNLLNKPVYLAGFEPMQAIGILIIIAVFLLADPKIGIAIIIVMAFVGGKIRIENSKGNPSFIDSFMAFASTKKTITDTYKILSFLEKTSNGN